MADFSNYMSPGRKGYLIGIGGVSMSSLAEVLLGMGINVCGSDSNRSGNVRSLEGPRIFLQTSILLSVRRPYGMKTPKSAGPES